MDLTIIYIYNMDQSSLKKFKHITQLFKIVQFVIPRSVDHKFYTESQSLTSILDNTK